MALTKASKVFHHVKSKGGNLLRFEIYEKFRTKFQGCWLTSLRSQLRRVGRRRRASVIFCARDFAIAEQSLNIINIQILF